MNTNIINICSVLSARIKDVGVFDEDQVQIGTVDLYIEGVHTQDAAQTTMALGIDYELLKGFFG